MLHSLIRAIPVFTLRQRLSRCVFGHTTAKSAARHGAVLPLSRILPRLALVAERIDRWLVLVVFAFLSGRVDLGVARGKVGAELVGNVNSLSSVLTVKMRQDQGLSKGIVLTYLVHVEVYAVEQEAERLIRTSLWSLTQARFSPHRIRAGYVITGTPKRT